MPYTSRYGRRPNEYASKSSHGYIIKDPDVQAFLSSCDMPRQASDVQISKDRCVPFSHPDNNPIKVIIAVDGGYNEVAVRTEFPSATICFFQLGAIIFSVEDLETMDEQPFIDPADMARLNNIQRFKLTLPVRNITLSKETTLTASVRHAMFDFFCAKHDGSSLIETLKWFIFSEYDQPISEWMLSSCPLCEQSNVPLNRDKMSPNYNFKCDSCGGDILLTDVFRLHEAIDNELGAGGILGYVTTTVEQMILVYLIHLILKTKPSLLGQTLFVKDGPLAFFGQTANMHKPMRRLVNFLFDRHKLYMAGLEKSGAFVEHADEIRELLDNGSMLLIDNDYLYKYILPGKADPSNPYGRTTYYGNKLIFKTSSGDMYVASLPTSTVLSHPNASDFPNLQVVLSNLEKLRCDMYDNSLVPIALANKLVSLANHPSSRILQKFAIGTMSK
ncbi:MAG: DNA double-strand break repair nuclease NurA [Anaerolineae bacterium]|nr:DNA double-strand break repair nuclease NurA [Anaerolineae bacterium]